MREFRPYGSVRGARSNARPYRDSPTMTAGVVIQLKSTLILAHMGQRPRLQKGCPDSRRGIGSYERWSRTKIGTGPETHDRSNPGFIALCESVLALLGVVRNAPAAAYPREAAPAA